MIIERTTYWPQPGLLEDVLELRREACRVRADLDLAAGLIATERRSGSAEKVVHWECTFAGAAEHSADLRARDESAAFSDVRKRMHAVIKDFRRSIAMLEPRYGTRIVDRPVANRIIEPRVVRFLSEGLELTGYLYLPDGPGPHPCLITNHGSTIEQGTDDRCRPGSAAVFLSWGIASLLPHRRGYGASPGTPWREAVAAPVGSPEYDRGLTRRLEEESRDVAAAADYLAGLPEIDTDHIGVIGSSFGGTVSLLAASRCARLRCLVEFAGAAMNWECAPGLRDQMLRAASTLSCPAFFIQAANDYCTRPTPELAAAMAAEARATVQHRVFPPFGITAEEGHLFYGNGAAVWGQAVRTFLERWL